MFRKVVDQHSKYTFKMLLDDFDTLKQLGPIRELQMNQKTATTLALPFMVAFPGRPLELRINGVAIVINEKVPDYCILNPVGSKEISIQTKLLNQ